MINCVIVEDELSGQMLLRERLARLFPEVSIVGLFDQPKQAIDFLESQKVDLVFLDNRLKGGYGLDVLQRFPEPEFEVIITTAYTEYAIDALNSGALYYLLKPFSEEDFMLAVELALKKIAAKTRFLFLGGNRSLRLSEILFAQSVGAYTIFKLKDGSSVMTSKNIGFYEKRLPDNSFFRIHHSCIVNLDVVKEVDSGANPTVLLEDGLTRLSISQRRLKAFAKRFGLL